MEAGQELTFYVPSSRFAASLGDEPQVVEVVDIVEITPIAAPSAPAASPSGEPASLPKTASNLPWLAVSGAFLILCATGVTLLRRRFSRRGSSPRTCAAAAVHVNMSTVSASRCEAETGFFFVQR